MTSLCWVRAAFPSPHAVWQSFHAATANGASMHVAYGVRRVIMQRQQGRTLALSRYWHSFSIWHAEGLPQ